MENKSDLRIKFKELRKTFDIKSRSKILVSKIRDLSAYQGSKHVMLYYPLKYEIDLLDLLKDDKKFYFPRVNGNALEVCGYDGSFKKSELNIYEPCSQSVEPDILELVIVPALAVDKDNFRLGYGGGFYDRFIAEYPNITTLTPIHTECVMDSLPHEKYDKKISIIVHHQQCI